MKNVLCISLAILFFQQKERTFYLVDKGVYVNHNSDSNETKIPYKENHFFYLHQKNDSTLLLKEVYRKKIINVREYRIADKCDTSYVRRYSNSNGKKKSNLERVVFLKAWPKDQ